VGQGAKESHRIHFLLYYCNWNLRVELYHLLRRMALS